MGKIDTIYCHFSYRRPKGQNFAVFTSAFYKDEEGTEYICHFTRAFNMWENQQYVCGVQSYEHALYCIWVNQKELIERGISVVNLVTDNSALAKWIADPKSNKNYTYWINRAQSNYALGKNKEININVGLCKPTRSEKSYKFNTIDQIINKIPEVKFNVGGNQVNKLGVNGNVKSIKSIVKEYTTTPVTNIELIDPNDVFID